MSQYLIIYKNPQTVVMAPLAKQELMPCVQLRAWVVVINWFD
jgi:hypothetical protein